MRQARAVDHEVPRLARRDPRRVVREPATSAAERDVIRHRELHTKQAKHAANKTFRLPERETKDRT